MKIEAGMYVRFFNGDIGKIADYEYAEEYTNGHKIRLEGKKIGWCWEEKDFKASHNIIDLIETGDYVNGYEVTSKDQFLGFGNHDWYIADYEIKSIVTKEQFESVKYKVGE